jgi:hypothetical protein
MELGRIEDVEDEIARYAQEADRVGLPHHRWYVPLWRAALAVLRGRMGEAEALIEAARVLGARADDPNADLFTRIQRTQLLLDGGRHDEIDRGFVERGAGSSPAAWAWLTWLAWIDAVTGAEAQAQERVDLLARDGFAAVRLDANWHGVLDLCEAVVLLGDVERAAALRALLAPHSGRVAAVARAALCCGPIDHHLGRLALVCGDVAAATAHHERALAWCERAGAEPGIARARAGLADARAGTISRPRPPGRPGGAAR